MVHSSSRDSPASPTPAVRAGSCVRLPGFVWLAAPAPPARLVGPADVEDGVDALIPAVDAQQVGEGLLIDPHVGADLVPPLAQEVAPGAEQGADVHRGGLVGEVVVLEAGLPVVDGQQQVVVAGPRVALGGGHRRRMVAQGEHVPGMVEGRVVVDPGSEVGPAAHDAVDRDGVAAAAGGRAPAPPVVAGLRQDLRVVVAVDPGALREQAVGQVEQIGQDIRPRRPPQAVRGVVQQAAAGGGVGQDEALSGRVDLLVGRGVLPVDAPGVGGHATLHAVDDEVGVAGRGPFDGHGVPQGDCLSGHGQGSFTETGAARGRASDGGRRGGAGIGSARLVPGFGACAGRAGGASRSRWGPGRARGP